MNRSNLSFVVLILGLSVFLGCPLATAELEYGEIYEAVAVIEPTEGSKVSGIVRFSQVGDRIRIATAIEGLVPLAQHGFHIHEFGDARSSNGASAGGHYNPEHHDHALPEANLERHAGDLGNLKADADGYAAQVMETVLVTINGSHNPILGRAVIIHANTDDGGQPTGNAGPRIGIGIIGIANPDH